eukprot:TRINITY_DN6642_c0_g1_i4.p1 TRINITY_DN6642_c0_g1~~TRINITY_DN6642_c0_g1_i4.p1  ORF type:complete len:338 (+),score=91.82 TRINITY_DN6642_c0_g1_i4:239-1252(+)
MKGLVLTATGDPVNNYKLVEDVPKPEPGSDDVLIKVHACGLNPVDVAQASTGMFIGSELPIPLGCDPAGVVEAVGSNVTTLKVGDAVTACPPLGTKGCGGLAEYCITPADLCIRKPDSMAFEEAATVAVGAKTAALGLFVGLGLPLPSQESSFGQDILIWGGTTNVGVFSIQLAKKIGARVITTCSAKNADYARELGADVVVDYRSETWLDEIKKAAPNLRLAYDTVGTASSEQCMQAMNTDDKCKFYTCASFDAKPLHDNISMGLAMLGDIYTPDAADRRAALRPFVAELSGLLADGSVRPARVEPLDGLEAVPAGYQRIVDKKVSACKLVAVIAK